VPEQEVATDQPLGELGIDSLTAAEFSAGIEEDTGANVPLERFLGGDTLEEVARRLAEDPRGFDDADIEAAAGPTRAGAL
jgi:acyl carrier protein